MRFLSLYSLQGYSHGLTRDTKRGFLFVSRLPSGDDAGRKSARFDPQSEVVPKNERMVEQC